MSDADEEQWSEMDIQGYTSPNSRITIPLSNRGMTLHCIEALTPLDMIHLSRGEEDLTGNKVWMGAHLFVRAASQKLLSLGKLTIELGCGTGSCGISLLILGETRFVNFTDLDEKVLELCWRNCILNVGDDATEVDLGDCEKMEVDDSYYAITNLAWVDGSSDIDDSLACQCSYYDTVIASDVIYDISAIQPLLNTAFTLLKPQGNFILSHVPRASLKGDVVSSASSLEELIVREAVGVGFSQEVGIVRPRQMEGGKGLVPSLEEMEDAGAAILIFQKG